jgi:tRNA(Ile)-lysidine synthase
MSGRLKAFLIKMNLTERALKTFRDYDMLRPGDSVIAAVSGGPDSIFLIYVLRRLKDKLKLTSLSVCNLDHGLRGEESRVDSLFVKNAAREAGLKFFHKKVRIKKLKRENLSTEEAARQARYKFYFAAAKKAGANVIATGHTLDDQAETVLMRLIKGASLKGAAGIPPVREEGKFRFIRPLLGIEKREIKKYLDDEGISYRMDSTNLEPVYFRNVVRNEVIPFLERYNPRLKRAMFNFAEHLREDYEFIREAKHRSSLIPHPSRLKQGAIELRLKDIVIQPKALQKEILRDALERAGGEVKRLSYRHWKEIDALIRCKRTGNAVDLPGGIRLKRTASTLVFHRL